MNYPQYFETMSLPATCMKPDPGAMFVPPPHTQVAEPLTHSHPNSISHTRLKQHMQGPASLLSRAAYL
jgi:hypothetical protein